MGPQRGLKIYVGYESSSIIKYLEPITGDLFTARFVDYHFEEIIYPTLGGKNKQLERKIDWNALSLSPLDFRTNKCELEVQRIIHLQNIANQLPNAFTDLSRIIKSQIPAANAPIRVDVPIGQLSNANESKPHLKRGRPIDSKDKNPKKRRANGQNNHNMKEGTHEEQQHITIDETSEKVQFVYTNLRSTHEEVQRLDFSTINGVELNNDESALSHDTYPDRSGKRYVVHIHTQSDIDIKDDELEGFTTGVPSIDNFEEMNVVTNFKDKGKKDFEGFSSDVETSTLDAQVEEMVNQKLEDFGTATLNALVDAVVNQNSNYSKIQNSMIENIHEDHSHIDVIFYHLRKKSKLRTNQEYRFTTTNCFFKNYVEKTYRRYYPNDSDTVRSTQQNYAESVVVADNENLINNIIKGFSIPAGLPWHLVDEVYALMNCNQNFHWVLAIIDLKDRRICVYDSLSNLRNMDLFPEIQKLAVMLPTFLSDSGFFEKKFRTNWSNLDAYRDKLSDTTQLLNTNSFEVEYVQNIIQQDCDSLDYGVFVAGYAEYISEGMSIPPVDFEAVDNILDATIESMGPITRNKANLLGQQTIEVSFVLSSAFDLQPSKGTRFLPNELEEEENIAEIVEKTLV
ncbi:hypothetical protein BC332_13876 [Capsicum chinense]|nr:hypothetical protein BC332_13876 [Capsicum chinense]